MKQIIFIMLLISNIQANTTQQEICQFKKVIKNGWSENNQTLNQKIIDLGKVEVPRIIQKLNIPIKADENKSAIIKIPKIELTRNDYIILMSYTKYLEVNNKIPEAIKIYIESFKGLANTTNTSMLSAIFKLAINNVLTKSLEQALKEKVFTSDDKLFLYNKLSKLLILDNYYIIEGIKSEKNINFQLINQMKTDKYNKVYLKTYKQAFHKVNDDYWNTLINATRMNNLFKTQHNEEERLNRLLFWNKTKLFFLAKKLNIYRELSIPIDKEDYIHHAKYSAINTLLITRPKLYETCQNYLNMIDNNKKLLLKLKEKQ